MKKGFVIVLGLILSFNIFGCTNKPSSKVLVKPKINITDTNGLYEFVNAEVFTISRDDFKHSLEITYLDVTGDGFDEAIIVNNNDWSRNVEIVSVVGDKYKNIKTDLKIAKYANKFTMQDGFLKVMQSTGGTGVSEDLMSLLIYDKGRMVSVLKGLVISKTEAWSNGQSEETCRIAGPLTDFEYTLTRHENGNESMMAHSHYTYNKKMLRFDETNE